MNVSGVLFDDCANGSGIRITIFVSGCKHKCRGCHNKETWDFKNGEPFNIDMQTAIFNKIANSEYIEGITLSGGDPMYHAEELLFFVKKYRQLFPEKTLWLYTGFTFEEIKEDSAKWKLAKECDVIVDGPFKIKEIDNSVSFRGSLNQRIIDVNESIASKSIIIWDPTYY